MKNNYAILTENEKRKYKNWNIKYPFTKMKQGFNKKTNFLYKEIEKTNKVINSQLDLLLSVGFEGTEKDFQNLYHPHQKVKNDKLKNRLKYRRNSMIFPKYFSETIKLTKIKEFRISIKNRKNTSNYIKILRNSILMNKEKKENETNYREKIRKINSESSISNLSSNSYNINTFKNNKNKNNTLTYNKYNSARKLKYEEEKAKRIKKIRSLLNKKSNEILFNRYYSFQEKRNKKNKIGINIDNGNLLTNKKLTYKTLYLKEPEYKINDKNEEKFNNKVNKVFKKYINTMRNDIEKFKKILDPLNKVFKSNLKEVQKFRGNSRVNIWMKKSTANLISFGDTFQTMDDGMFYKDHKKIIRQYPDIQKDAQIFEPVSNKVRDNSVGKNLEKNEKKIKFIISDNDSLLRRIKKKFLNNIMKKSKSQLLIKIKK